MPKQRDPKEVERLRTLKMIHKLIKYMKKSWRVKVSHKQQERELVYRTLYTVSTRKPDNWRDLVDRREEFAIRSGFFTGFDGPFVPLVDLELDTPMLVLNNLTPELKISPNRWLRARALKEERKRQREAFLMRLPRDKLKAPVIPSVKLQRDPGGMEETNEMVKMYERFEQLCRGGKSYRKVLAEWEKRKEEENECANFGFGTVSPDFKYGFSALYNRPKDKKVRQQNVYDPFRRRNIHQQMECKF